MTITLEELRAMLDALGYALWDVERRCWVSRDDLFTILKDRARELKPDSLEAGYDRGL